MNAELLPVWASTWPELWSRLAKSAEAPDDLFIGLVGELATEPQPPAVPLPPSPHAFDEAGALVDRATIRARDEYDKAQLLYNSARDKYVSALSSEPLAKQFFRGMLLKISSEYDAVKFLESVHESLIALEYNDLTNIYKKLVVEFLQKFSLRYEMRGPFSLRATMPGVFVKMMREIKIIACGDAHLRSLMEEFEEAFSDLREERTQAKIKTCLQKQFNLVEGLGGRYPGVTELTLGAMCNQLDWPHATVKELGKKLYGFGSSYPGVRHAGNPQGVLRNLDMRDFVSLSLMLASFTPYVTHGLEADRCYSA
jgi:hypothetical protein